MPTRFRNVKSKCLVFSSWTALSRDIKGGKKRASPLSRAKPVVIQFHRGGKITYTLNKSMTLKTWLAFMNAGSIGRYFNLFVRGRYG